MDRVVKTRINRKKMAEIGHAKMGQSLTCHTQLICTAVAVLQPEYKHMTLLDNTFANVFTPIEFVLTFWLSRCRV